MFTHTMIFSKHIASLPLPEAAKKLAAAGITSVDLTVRRRGHVEPDNVERGLPETAKILAASGISIGMITTDIVEADNPITRRVLKTAAAKVRASTAR